MTAGAMVTAAGAAVMLYFILRRSTARKKEEEKWSRSRRWRVKVTQAPANLLESMATISETVRFTYSETLGMWPIADLAFGINYFIRKQGDLAVASVYGGSGCVKLNGAEVVAELRGLLRLLTFCMLFSKKPFHQFLDAAGFSMDHVLLHNPTAELLKPAFTIIRDTESKCFLLLIRGTHSIKDTLTAANGAVVPFHHSILNDGEINNLVLGYAHCGMVAAARWIANLCTPTLLKALAECPDFKVKIVGHSLGGGTAALLTYILREQKELSSSTCVAFAPAACMTWELAESGKHFITTIINNSDLVPTFSASSVDDLRSEVAASSWLNDIWDQVEHTKVLNVVYRSATALGSRIQSLSSSKDRIVGAKDIKLENLAEASEVPMLNKDEPNSSSGGHVHDAIDEDITTSAVDNITEGELWCELEKELRTPNPYALIEEAAAAKEITEEENQLLDAAQGSNDSITTRDDDVDSYRFYPPGKIMHIVTDDSSSNSIEEHVNLYETPRQLYSKLRLSRTMINDHYMPMYKKMIQLLIRELEKDDNVK